MKYVDASGRFCTDFQPICQLNAELEQKYKTKDIHAYRYYLQNNAIQVMKDLLPVSEPCNMTKNCPICQKALSFVPSGGHTHQQWDQSHSF